MVEEGAGTMVYITKRDATLKIMADKEKRVTETRNILKEVIVPKMESLQKNRQDEIDRQKLNRQCEKLQSQVAARTAYEHKVRINTRNLFSCLHGLFFYISPVFRF